MARKASELTKAIRRLCEQSNFSITHSEARPKLMAMGFKLVDDPPKKSEAYRAWEEFATNRPKKPEEMPAWYKSTVKNAGLSPKSVEVVMQEDTAHRAFVAERGYFDVTKYNYQRKVGGHVSHKPESTNPPAKRPRVLGRKHKLAVVAKTLSNPKDFVANLSSDVESIKWLVQQGGAAAVEKKIAELKASIDEMNGNLEKANSALSKLTNSAA
jgi:hypothetical protein